MSTDGVTIVDPLASRVYIHEGQDANVECRSALGVDVKWYVNGSTIGASDHGKITVTRQTSRNSSWFSWLRIVDVQHEVTIRCQNVHDTMDYDELDVIINRSNPDSAAANSRRLSSHLMNNKT